MSGDCWMDPYRNKFSRFGADLAKISVPTRFRPDPDLHHWYVEWWHTSLAGRAKEVLYCRSRSGTFWAAIKRISWPFSEINCIMPAQLLSGKEVAQGRESDSFSFSTFRLHDITLYYTNLYLHCFELGLFLLNQWSGFSGLIPWFTQNLPN